MLKRTRKKRFLKVVSTPSQIENHPMNTSKTKNLYSFPKQKRFDTTNNKNNYKFYNIKLTNLKSSRFYSIPRAKRAFITNIRRYTDVLLYDKQYNTI